MKRRFLAFDQWFNIPFTKEKAGVFVFLIKEYKHNKRGLGFRFEFEKRGTNYRAGWSIELEVKLWWRNLEIGFDWDGEPKDKKSNLNFGGGVDGI